MSFDKTGYYASHPVTSTVGNVYRGNGSLQRDTLFFGRPYYRSRLWYSVSSVICDVFVLWWNDTS